MKLNRNSWFVTTYLQIPTHRSEWRIPQTFCQLFWSFIGHTAMYLVVTACIAGLTAMVLWGFVVPFLLLFGVALSGQNPFNIIGPVLAFGLLIGLFVHFVAIPWFGKRAAAREQAELEAWRRGETLPKKQPNKFKELVVAYWEGFHNKTCRIIQWESTPPKEESTED